MTAPEPADHVSIETLLQHREWVRALARSLYLDTNRADDVEQETWRRTLERPPRHAASLRAWFAKAVRNAAHTAGRKERTRSARESAAVPRTPSPSPEDAVAAAELQTKLARAVLELDEPYRTTVVLRYFEGLEAAQIAARLGVPVETVRTRVKRAVARLRERMGLDLRDDRDAWCLLVFGVRAADVRPATLWSGGTAMATAKTYVTAAAVLALCVGVWWWRHDEGAAAVPRPSNAETAKAKTDAPVHPPRARVETAAPTATNVETAAPAPAAVPPGASVRLRFVDETGAVLSGEALRARWGGGIATPSVALFDDRALRSANRSDWLRQMVEGTPEALRPTQLDGSPDAFALKDRVPFGRWRLVVFPGAACSTLTRPFTIAKDGGAIDVDVVLAATPMRVVRVTDRATHAVVAGARLVPYFEFGDDGAFVAGSAVTADAAGEARLPVEPGDSRLSQRPPTWWATAPGRVGSFVVRSDSDAPMVVALDRTFDVEGDAFLADGSPAAGRRVCWQNKGFSISTECDAAGHFRLAGLPSSAPSQQQIFLVEDEARGVMRRATVQATPGGTTTMRFGAPAADAARILVRLTAGGRPVPGMAVTCRSGEGGTMALTDSDGTATLADIAVGAQPTVIVLLCDPRVVQDFTAAAPQTPLAAGEERRLALDLPVGAVRVRVVAADGSPVPGAHVVARSTDKSAADPKGKPLTPSPEGWAVKFGDARFADDDGAALLTGLPVDAVCEVSASDGVAGLAASAPVNPGTSDAPAEVTLVLK